MLLPDPRCLELDHAVAEKDSVTMVVTTKLATAQCPKCDQPSPRVHSRYRRTLADLPWQGIRVRLRLQSRKFFCPNGDCPQTIFTERLPSVVEPYARRTLRLDEALSQLGCALGGEAGARVARKLAVSASPDQLLRCVRRTPGRKADVPRVLGVDDWAWRKGQRYGTILVDLERRRPVDLLPDRQAETLASWLRAHPGVEVITRDRANAYADGARQGAPQALQVADRWHLLKNLSEALERLLNRKHRLLRQSAERLRGEKALPAVRTGAVPSCPDGQKQPASARQSQQRRARRYARYSEVVSLYRQGVTIRAIAQQFGMHRRTVRQFVRADRFPERAKPKARRNQIDPFVPYLKRRWEEGAHNTAQLWREIQAEGFQGSDSSLRHSLARWRCNLPSPFQRQQGAGPVPADPPMRIPSPPQAVWLLLRGQVELQPEQHQFVETLCSLCPEIQTARALAHEFQQVVRGRQSQALGGWLEAAGQSGLPELQSFAAGLRRDHSAVAAALTLEWSNGQVEGQIHRLKLVKRQAYGRAKFDLLRARFLQAA